MAIARIYEYKIENNILSLKDHAEIIVSLLKDLDNETMKFKKQIALAAAVTVISSAFLAGCGENKKQTTPAELTIRRQKSILPLQFCCS